MAKEWLVFDKWEGGGFFADGSYDASERFHALNMQRYQNGSIGPRPQWRKMTQSADAASSIPSIALANKNALLQGATWAAYGPTGWSYGAILLHADDTLAATTTRRIKVSATGTAEYFAASNRLGVDHTSAVQLRSATEPFRVNAVQNFVDGSRPVWIGGENLYDASANTVSTIGPRTVAASAFYPSKVALYRGRMYGWMPRNIAHPSAESIVFSTATDPSDFNGTDSGDFKFSSGIVSLTMPPALPRGVWAMPNGLLIFSSEGPVRQFSRYDGVTTPYSDHGRWDILTGRNPTVGSVQQIGWDVGPLYHSLSIVFQGRLMFPIYDRGWAIHDGQNLLDKDSLAALRPGHGAYASVLWHNPVALDVKPSLILPYRINDSITVDTTGDNQADITAGIGEFFQGGYGSLEFVNNTWTEHHYMNGLGDLIGYGKLEEDKLFVMHAETSDNGANYYPQVYVRDITLDRPATTTSQNTYNPFSDGVENSVHMQCRLETGERMAPNGMQYEISQVTVDYDYWNSSLFDSDCGFEVEIIYRGMRDREKLMQRVNTGRVVPPGTSLSYFPKRARVILNLPKRIAAGSFQVRIRDLKGCAIHAVAAAIDVVRAY